jgi:PTS system mannitol-specific IIA component
MAILSREQIRINVQVSNKTEAIRLVGQLLVDSGHVPATYIDFMLKRDEDLSTYMGAGLAIPHGTNDAKKLIHSTGLAVLVVPEGVDFGNGEIAHLIVGIAAIGDDHMDLLTSIAMIVSDETKNESIQKATSEDEILTIFLEGVES